MNNEDNIFDSPLASFEFAESICEKIVHDWKEERMDDNSGLYTWLKGPFTDSLISKIERRLEK